VFEIAYATVMAILVWATGLVSEHWARNLKKQILHNLLVKKGYDWRSIKQLSRAIGNGKDYAPTRNLLLEMGAKRSAGEKEVWTLST